MEGSREPAAPRRRAVIVDDERLARRDLAFELAAFPHVDVVGEAETVAEAVRVCETLAPELLFLDIELPDGTGFDVLMNLTSAKRPGDRSRDESKTRESPRVIFVTAHDRFAVRAFEVNALDYLLKPVERSRLAEALARLDERDRERDLPPFEPTDHFCATDGAFRGFVAVRTIRRVSAQGNYTQIYTTDGRELQVKKSLHAWEGRLPPEQFARINRNDLVQIALITKLVPSIGGRYAVHLAGEAEPLAVSRRSLMLLRERLRQPI